MEHETSTSLSKREQVVIKTIWAILWTLICLVLASTIVWKLLIYSAFGSAYSQSDLGEQVITQEGYDERLRWFQFAQTTALACIPLSLLIWTVGLILIIRSKNI